jgi:hypothetical protein
LAYLDIIHIVGLMVGHYEVEGYTLDNELTKIVIIGREQVTII